MAGYAPSFGTSPASAPSGAIIGTGPAVFTKASYLQGTPLGVPVGVLPAGVAGGPPSRDAAPEPRMTMPGAALTGSGDPALVPTILEADD